MRRFVLMLLVLVPPAAVLMHTPAVASAAPAPDAIADAVTGGIPGVIAPGTRTQLIRAGFNGTEGVIAMPDGSVLFCELNANRIIHLDLAGRFSTYLEDTDRAIGLGFDHKGRLIATQSRDPQVSELAPRRMMLADAFAGQPLVRPNDLIIDRKGGIYFSDPLPPVQAQFREPPAGRKPLVLYIRPDGVLTKVSDELGKPNGLQLSGNEKILYAVDGDRIVAFDVQADGSVSNLRKFVDAPGGDGLAMDSADRLYIAGAQGIGVVSPGGQILGLIPTPVRIQSIAFAGPDRKTLYAVGQGAVYRIPLLARGVRGRAK